MGLVPGINDLMRGFPWPKSTSTPLRPIDSRPKLVSFEKSGLKSFCESAASSTIAASFQCSSPPPSNTELENHLLQMPKYASNTQGGWMDPSSWFFELIWKDVQEFSLDALYNAYFTRDWREEYGKDHASNKRVRCEMLDAAERGDKHTSKGNHSKQERDRRERHRWLQREADNTIPTFMFNWAKKVLPLVKVEAKEASRRRELVDEDNSIKNQTQKAQKDAGKDDQLTAAVMTQHLASILICRQHEHIINQCERIAKLEAKIASISQQQQQHEQRQHQCLHEERDLSLRSTVSKPVQAAVQECKGLKRTLYETEQPSTIISQQSPMWPHETKRQRHLPKPMMHFHHSSSTHNCLPGSGLLPPSPTPSHEGYASYFFCAK